MRVHRAVNNHDSEAILAALDAGDDINEVEAAGNTPLHFAAFQGWEEGVRMLLHMGAKIDASNNVRFPPERFCAQRGGDEALPVLAGWSEGVARGQEHVSRRGD